MKMHPRNKYLLVTIFLLSLFVLSGTPKFLYDTGRTLYDKIELFSQILRTIQNDYIDEKPSQELLENAIQGMVSNLDPHTTYLSADQFNKWNQNFEGYSGIGISFDVRRDKITVMSVTADGPSDKVGLMSGDRIVAIDKQSAVGMKRDDVPLKLMGPKGTKVEVTVERKGWDEPKNFIITRDEVHVESVPYALMMKPDVGYMKIIRFSSTTGEEVEKKLLQLKSQGMKQLILDLRQNGGGYLESAVEVADKFLPGGKRIVYTKGRMQASFREYFATDRTAHPYIPIIVIIDRASASASEIVAGALQDWDRALIAGETSFGKGLVQSQYRFNDGSALLMTTAKYYTPTGRLIQRPFDDKSFEEYYTEVMIDSLRKNRDDDQSRPVFQSKILKRKVYGGGGITPDIFMPAEKDTSSQVIRRMLFYPQRLFYTFVEDYLKDPSEMQMELNDFLKNYVPNGKVMQHFFNHIRKCEFKISNQEFIQNTQEIKFFLKQAIAEKVWGDEARYKVQILDDHQLLETLEHFPEAESLLKKAYSL
jgi:carboxyl-terminal processing protease